MTPVSAPTLHSQQKVWDVVAAKYFILWLLLTVAILGAAGFFVLRSPYQAWRSLAHTQALEPQLEGYSTKLEALKNELAAWQQLPLEQRHQVELMLPSSVDLPNLLTQLEAVANQAGFHVQAIAVGDSATPRGQSKALTTEPNNLKHVQVTVSLTGGNYTTFKQLIVVLQSAWRLLRLESFGFSSDDDSYRFELTAFYYPT